MKDINPQQSVFYSIEQAIKEYRKYAQGQISKAVPKITLDQVLVLILINNDKYSQTELSQLLFKDFASLTRMIELLVKNGFLTRSVSKNDRRRNSLKLTPKGKESLEILRPIIFQNRINALNTITDQEIENLKLVLNKITNNCKNNSL
jgi:DNA-binding MarR family transcriptional regulator